MTDWAMLVVLACCGLGVGSFCTVVVDRLPHRRSVLPRSICDHCGLPVPSRHNLPVWSWLLLRGRAKCCNMRIDGRYPLIEASVPALWVALALLTEPAWLLAVLLPFSAGAVCVTFIDIEHYRIPSPLAYAMAWASVLGAGAVAEFADVPPAGAGWPGLLVSAVNGVAVSTILLVVRCIWPEGMGMGDVRFAFSAGVTSAAAAGPIAGLMALTVACISGTATGCMLPLLRGQRLDKEARRIPFGPHLALGAVLTSIWGGAWWDAYMSAWK